ncbi:hypothetical protein L0337_34150 [candidate division KSB1 bacterium]|nr:hypothetical protein [candidate division KSB1 bacterium]
MNLIRVEIILEFPNDLAREVDRKLTNSLKQFDASRKFRIIANAKNIDIGVE